MMFFFLFREIRGILYQGDFSEDNCDLVIQFRCKYERIARYNLMPYTSNVSQGVNGGEIDKPQITIFFFLIASLASGYMSVFSKHRYQPKAQSRPRTRFRPLQSISPFAVIVASALPSDKTMVPFGICGRRSILNDLLGELGKAIVDCLIFFN